jgi:hypothetical protein
MELDYRYRRRRVSVFMAGHRGLAGGDALRIAG